MHAACPNSVNCKMSDIKITHKDPEFLYDCFYRRELLKELRPIQSIVKAMHIGKSLFESIIFIDYEGGD